MAIKPEDWFSVKEFIEPKYSYSLEVAQFLDDIDRMEYNSGKFSFISKYNRMKLQEITEAENYIKHQYKIINSVK